MRVFNAVTFNPGLLYRLLESGFSIFSRLIGIRLGSLLALSAALLIASCGGGGGTTSVASDCIAYTDSFNNPVSCQEMANLAASNGGGGGDGSGDAGADGSAGDGAPIANTKLRFVDINNRVIETSTDANGYFRINLRGMKAPIVANVLRTDLVWRSMLVSEIVPAPANRKFYTINLTALTDKIASDVAVAAGRSGPAQLTPADVLKNLAAVQIAKQALNNQLKEKLLDAGLNPASFDALTQPFKTDLTGYDLVLEHVAVVQNTAGTTELLPKHSVGGSISGGNHRIGLVLKNGSDAIGIGSVPSDGRIGFIRLWNNVSGSISIDNNSASSFTLPVQLLPGTRYDVQIATQPAAATCAVNNGSGVMADANVTTVAVVCTDTPYSLGGSISGLGSSSGLTLSVNNAQTLMVPANASSFSFATGLPTDTAYNVSIASQPVGATCSVAGGSGSMPAANLNLVVVTCSATSARLGGSLSGLTTSGLVLGAAGQTASPAANAASFSFANPLAYGSAYSVSVLTQPTGLTCVVNNGSGSMGIADVNNVAVSCSVKAASLGGLVKNLTGTGLQLVSNGQTVTVTPLSGTPRPDVSFTFGTPLAGGSSYSVTVKTQPAGQSCTVGNGSGSMSGMPVTSVVVTCNTIPLFTVGGTVSGNSNGLVLGAGADSKSFASEACSPTCPNANFTFGTALAAGTSYNVTVQTQPAGQTCTVSNGSGVMPAANVSNVSVNCIGNPSTLGGTVINLTGSGLVLTGSGQNVDVSPSASAATPKPDVSFTFATALAAGTSYNVTVQTQPSGQTCTVSNGSGVMAAANVDNVTVSCSSSASTLGGTLSNLTGTGMVLTTSSGQTVGIAANATSFTFPTPVTTGTSYSITVKTQPAGQTCSVSNGSGVMPAADVSNVSVSCVTTPVAVNGVCGSANNVAVLTQPTANLCSAGTAGAITGSGPWSWSCSDSNGGATASCAAGLADSPHFLGGSANGNNAGLVLSSNGQTVTVPSIVCVTAPCLAGFAFPNALATGTSYNVTVQTQPSGQTCTVSNGSGVMPAANVTNVSVSCSSIPSYKLGGTVANLTGSVLVLASNGQTVGLAANASSFTFPNGLPAGTAYNVTVQTQPSGQTCSVSLGSAVMPAADVSSVSVTCVTTPVAIDGVCGSANNVAVLTQPTANLCSAGSAGAVAGSGPWNWSCSGSNGGSSASCAAGLAVIPKYSVSGGISGLGNASGLVLSNNAAEDLPVAANAGSFVFATTLAQGTPYAVTVKTQPGGMNCTVSLGSGVMPAANVTNVLVSCSSIPSYKLGGTVANLTGSVLVLANNGQTVGLAANAGSFAFPNGLLAGTAYNVTVQTQPSGQTCTVSNGSGAMPAADVSSVSVACVPNPVNGVCGSANNVALLTQPTANLCSAGIESAIFGSGPWSWICSGSSGGTTTSCAAPLADSPHFLGGAASGNNAGLVLSSNGEAVAVPASGCSTCIAGFAFPTALATGTAYNVTVQSLPSGQTCTVSNGSGVMPAANVSNVTVTCVSTPVAVSGVCGSANNVAVLTQPTANLCSAGSAGAVNGSGPWNWSCSGSNGGASASCAAGLAVTPKFSVGGGISGLGNASGLVLSNNAAEDLPVAANAGSFVFATTLAQGTPYAVTVKTQPGGMNCTVSLGSGVMPAANVTNVLVSCSSIPSYKLGGTVANLTGSVLVLANNGQTVGLAANAGSFAFPNGLLAGTAYNVTVQTQPSGQTCTVSNGSGAMPAADVSSVLVTCVTTPVAVSGVCGSANNVAVLTQPTANLCSAGSAGAVAGSGPWSWSCTGSNGGATASCAAGLADTPHFLGGSASSNNAGLVLGSNGQTVAVTPSSCDPLQCSIVGFAFPNALATGTSYNVTVQTQPSGQTCTVSNGSGVMSAANVTNVLVACVNNVIPSTYTLTPTFATVNEGTAQTFTLNTTNVADGTQLSYTLSGTINAPDVDVPLTGSVTVFGNAATLTITPVADVMTEGTETATLAIATASSSLTINDTSTTPVASRYSTVGTFPVTDCVKDTTTGLTWEGKPQSGLRASGNTYTNYDSTTALQYQSAVAGYVAPTQSQIDAATNSIGYKNAVNASVLCGYTDWRLPTLTELHGLILIGVGPFTLDATWFPNAQFGYWTSTPEPNGLADFAWFVNFLNGSSFSLNRDLNHPLRLVR